MRQTYKGRAAAHNELSEFGFLSVRRLPADMLIPSHLLALHPYNGMPGVHFMLGPTGQFEWLFPAFGPGAYCHTPVPSSC